MSIFLVALIGLTVMIYLAQPFFESEVQGHGVISNYGDAKINARAKDAILDEIEDLDLEHAAGKIPDLAHEQLRAELVAKAAKLISQRAEPPMKGNN